MVDDLILFHQTNPFINLDMEYIISQNTPKISPNILSRFENTHIRTY